MLHNLIDTNWIATTQSNQTRLWFQIF